MREGRIIGRKERECWCLTQRGALPDNSELPQKAEQPSLSCSEPASPGTPTQAFQHSEGSPTLCVSHRKNLHALVTGLRNGGFGYLVIYLILFQARFVVYQ